MQQAGSISKQQRSPQYMPGSLYNLPRALRTGPVRSLPIPLSILLVNTTVKRAVRSIKPQDQAAPTAAHGSHSGVNTRNHSGRESKQMVGPAWRDADVDAGPSPSRFEPSAYMYGPLGALQQSEARCESRARAAWLFDLLEHSSGMRHRHSRNPAPCI